MHESIASVFVASVYARQTLGMDTHCQFSNSLASAIREAEESMHTWASDGFARDATALAITPDKEFYGIDLKMETQIIKLCEDNLYHVFNFKCYKYADMYWLVVSTDLTTTFQMYQYTGHEVMPGDDVNAIVVPSNKYLYGIACHDQDAISVSTLYLVDELPTFKVFSQLIHVEDSIEYAIEETLKGIFNANSGLSTDQLQELSGILKIGNAYIPGSSEEKSSRFSQCDNVEDDDDDYVIQASFSMSKAHMIHVIPDKDSEMAIEIFKRYQLKSPYVKKPIVSKFGILRVDQFTDKDGIIHHILCI